MAHNARVRNHWLDGKDHHVLEPGIVVCARWGAPEAAEVAQFGAVGRKP
ncbi:hypothetical protein [Streptomyces xantholiticus]